MPDITKGYTFSDSKADWASQKDTAIRLNKMIDEAKVNITAGSGISVARTGGNIQVSATGGGGTVTSVSASGLNGVTITGSPITTSGTISIGLGAITPTSVAASGKISGLNIPDVAFSRGSILVGDNSSPSQYRPLALGVAGYVLTSDGTDAYWDKKSPTLALGDIIYRGALADTYLSGNISTTKKFLSQTGTGSASAAPVWDSVTKTDVGLGNVTDHVQTQAAIVPNAAPTSGQILIGNAGNTAYAKQSVSGDITLSHTGAATIASNAVDNTKLAQVATSTFKGRTTAGTGNVEDLTSTQATALLNNFTSSLKGLVPSPSGSTRKYLRSDATWVDAPVYNVKDYGAVGNGSTNDASAINSAIADINTAGVGCLYFPQGVYVVSSALTTITASCSVMGTGVSSTEIQFTVSGFKFDFSGTANSKTARVSDMKLTRTSGSSLVGIEYVPTTDTNARHRFDFSHLNLFDWGTAIYINGGGQNQIQSGFISYCHINGSGTRANSPYAIRIKNATGVKINGCWFISVEKCVSVESHAESIGVQDCNAAAVDYFFYAVQDNVAGVPVLRADHRIINCYMAVDIRGVTIGNLDNINYCVIANNVIATQINTAEAIKIRGDYSSVIGNTIWPDKGSSPAVTIKVVSGNNNIISSNIIQDKAVVLESGTTSCRVVANTFKNVTGAFVSDSGTTNRCDEPTGKQVDKTLTGGAATENVDFDISAFGLSKKPQYFNAVISGTHGASKIMCCYDYGSASTTATNARCVAWMTDGTNLPSGSRTFNTAIVP